MNLSYGTSVGSGKASPVMRPVRKPQGITPADQARIGANLANLFASQRGDK